jgi:hypothetical protein
MRISIFLLIFFFPLFSIAQSEIDKPIENGEDLIVQMYNKHNSNWYQHLTFKQDIFRYRNDSLIRNEVWIVAYSSPSKLHLRYQDFDSGRGWLIVNDTLHSFNHNLLIGSRPRLHEAMILGLDVYNVLPDSILPKILKMDFDLATLCQTNINGKLVYQVGDPKKNCFWVLQENLLFYGVRRVSDTGVRDTFFENYKDFYGKPVATQIQYFQEGKLYLLEKYTEIRLPSHLPEIFFDPNHFSSTRW